MPDCPHFKCSHNYRYKILKPTLRCPPLHCTAQGDRHVSPKLSTRTSSYRRTGWWMVAGYCSPAVLTWSWSDLLSQPHLRVPLVAILEPPDSFEGKAVISEAETESLPRNGRSSSSWDWRGRKHLPSSGQMIVQFHSSSFFCSINEGQRGIRGSSCWRLPLVPVLLLVVRRVRGRLDLVNDLMNSFYWNWK